MTTKIYTWFVVSYTAAKGAPPGTKLLEDHESMKFV
jgi:hypothetical protein